MARGYRPPSHRSHDGWHGRPPARPRRDGPCRRRRSTCRARRAIANRALVCAALADGRSMIQRTARRRRHRGDARVPARARDRGRDRPADGVVVDGRGGTLPPGPLTLPTRLAGTTSRFVTALAALGPGPYVDRRRPAAAHTADGAAARRARRARGTVRPLEAAGRPAGHGRRTGHRWRTSAVRGDISSQFLTALMLIGPYLPVGSASSSRPHWCRGRTSRSPAR